MPEVSPEEISDVARVLQLVDLIIQIKLIMFFASLEFLEVLWMQSEIYYKKMKIAAAEAIAECVPDSELREDYIIPSIFRGSVNQLVAERVASAANE